MSVARHGWGRLQERPSTEWTEMLFRESSEGERTSRRL